MRNGVIWRLQRGGERYEAVVADAGAGQCELRYVLNGTLLHRMWLAAGRGIAAVEHALAERQHLKDDGWQECSDGQTAH